MWALPLPCDRYRDRSIKRSMQQQRRRSQKQQKIAKPRKHDKSTENLGHKASPGPRRLYAGVYLLSAALFRSFSPFRSLTLLLSSLRVCVCVCGVASRESRRTTSGPSLSRPSLSHATLLTYDYSTTSSSSSGNKLLQRSFLVRSFGWIGIEFVRSFVAAPRPQTPESARARETHSYIPSLPPSHIHTRRETYTRTRLSHVRVALSLSLIESRPSPRASRRAPRRRPRPTESFASSPSPSRTSPPRPPPPSSSIQHSKLASFTTAIAASLERVC